MADMIPDWLAALLQGQGNPNALSGGLLAGQLPPQTGGLLGRPTPVDPTMDYASDPNTPIRGMREGRSIADPNAIAPPIMTYVSPNAPFSDPSLPVQGGPAVPPPARGFVATDTADEPADTAPTNLKPAGTNVVGTAASGTTEASSPGPFGTGVQQQGNGGLLGGVSNFLGSLYGQGGPGDALISLGAGIASPEGWATGVQKSLATQSAAALNNARLKAFNLQMQQEANRQNATYNYFISKGLKPAEALAAVQDPALAKNYFEQYAGASNYDTVTGPDNSIWRVSKTDPSDRTQIFAGQPGLPKVIGEDESGNKTYGILGPHGETIPTDARGQPIPAGSRGAVSVSETLSPVKPVPQAGSKEAADLKAKGEAYLATLDPGFANTVRAVSEGREPYPVGLRTPAALKLKNAVNTYDPTFDYTNSQARSETRKDFAGDGVTGKALDSGRTGIGHIGHMSDIAEQLAQTNTSIPAFNKWKNQAAINFGGGLPALKYDTWADLVAKELTAFYSPGGGTGEERADIKNKLTSASSPGQLRAVLDTLGDAVSSKVNALQTRWHTGMGVHAPDFQILTPDNEAVLAKLKERAGSGDSVSQPATKLLPPPKIGERDPDTGMIYMGGDPSKASSWKPGVQM